MRALFLAVLLALSGTAAAEADTVPASEKTQPPAVLSTEIPTSEKEFVAAINAFDKASIVEQFGEPSKKNDIKSGRTGDVVASIWHYHYLNTDANGAYYQTTELDFIGDKVVMVVFLNNDGEDLPDEPAVDDGLLPTSEPTPEM